MYKPSSEDFEKLCQYGNMIPVYKEILADMDTPVSVLQKLMRDKEKNVFLIESVEQCERIGRYSFIGVNPRSILRIKNGEVFIEEDGEISREKLAGNPFETLKSILQRYKPVAHEELPRFIGGAVGYMGYGMVHYFENIPQDNPDDLNLDDAYFMITDTIVVFDHAKNKIMVVSNTHIDKDSDPKKVYAQAKNDIDSIIATLSQPIAMAPCEIVIPQEDVTLESNMTRDEFEDSVRKAKEYIRAGDIFQVVLSQRFKTKTTASPLSIYRALRSINPSPYMYFLYLDGFHIIGSSPEIMVRYEDGVAEVRPIAGTRKRGKNIAEDIELEKDLLADPKERAEHIMLVDLGRNDLGRVCEFKTVRLPQDQFMIIEHYSHVMHIVTDVIGSLKEGCDMFDLARAAFPAGTVSGAPKIRAMQIIDELENLCRGPYAGAVGYFSFHGNLDTAIAIRTMILKDDTVYIQAGAGIVADSDPSSEYLETVNKAKALFKAVQLAQQLENK
ncbi:MAG: anthranilate synthase component I [Candidatus Auribacterota bacterium]|jgi:anthranilate synthase component 1|nr:anthranilate synthase component I [Candidatus Auribacterota bacterium]